MDHKSFAAALPPEARLALTEKRDGPALLRLATHAGTIAALGLWIATGQPGWWLTVPLLGIMIAFLFAIEHEATHHTLLSRPWANDAVGRFAGLMILLPFEWFRWFHMAHHRHTNDAAKDPEIAGGKRPDTRLAWAWHISGIPYWMAEAKVILRLAKGSDIDAFIPANAVSRLVTEARVLLAIYVLAILSLFFSSFLFWVWLLPVIVGQIALRVFLLAEHADCPHVTNMFENTRTTLTSRLMRWVTWNASYHVEHHVFPMVPWYNLPRLHEAMKKELRVTADGYLAFTRGFLARH
jgi:fatty acid desaturase